jgi:MFS family permease
MMQWFKELSPPEKRTFAAAFAGWTLDALDFMVFTFVISALIGYFHIDKTQAGMLGTVTLLFSALGGWIAGMLADRYGRVRILQITILWFSICTFLIGFAQSFEQVFVLRALQGLGFGGEWAVGSVLMGEIVRAPYRGRAVGTVQSGWAVGWGIAALLYTLAFSWLPEEWAWRSLFWFSVLPSLLVVYIRRNVPEPEVYTQSRAAEVDSVAPVSPWTIFSPALLKTTLLSALLCTRCTGGLLRGHDVVAHILKTERHLSVIGTGAYLSVIIAGSFMGYISGAYFTDRFGRKPNLFLFAVLLRRERLYLYPNRVDQHRDAVRRFSAGLCRIGHLQRHRGLPDRVVSLLGSCQWSRLCL